MLLSRRRLNRTLLQRQRLLARVEAPVDMMVQHLVGLQAQEPLPPYLSLHARLTSFDPYDVSRGLDERSLVRLLTMRGTIHLLTPEDALSLRPWVQPRMEKEIRSNAAVRPVAGLDRGSFARAVEAVLDDGPLPQKQLTAALGQQFPDLPATALGQLARVALPSPASRPAGSGGSPAGSSTTTSNAGSGPLVGGRPGGGGASLPARLRARDRRGRHRLVRRHGADRRGARHDRPGAARGRERARAVRRTRRRARRRGDAGSRAPARDLRQPVALARGRDRVTTPENRRRWMGTNGGTGHTIFVDGMLEGLWRVADGRVEVIELFRDLSRTERDDLDAEKAGIEALLAR